MKAPASRRDCPLFAVILSGLCTAQILATIQVYISNLELHHTILTLSEAGYLTVPGKALMPRLKDLGDAFCGGLFFTLTIGSGLTLITLALMEARKYSLKVFKYLSALFILVIGMVLFAINGQGFSPMVSSYFLLIPLVVGSFNLKYGSNQAAQGNRLKICCHLSTILVLAVIWAIQSNPRIFVSIRDNILLSNPVGIAINDFYYEHTLYAAEVFKPLDMKTMKIVSISDNIKSSQKILLAKTLLDNNYLVIENSQTYDLKVLEEGDHFTFIRKNRRILKTTRKDFFQRPTFYLNKFSRMTDNHSLFRRLVFLSLLTGFPVMLYFILHGFIHLIVSFFLRPTPSFITATALCFSIALAFLLTVHSGHDGKINRKDLSAMLASHKRQEIVSALKSITQQSLEIQDYPIFRHLLKSPNISVRYWLAKALGVSHNPETYPYLLGLINDSHPNVTWQAVYGIGRRGDKRAIDKILYCLQASDHWYFQLYAYNALRSLGWKPNKSD